MAAMVFKNARYVPARPRARGAPRGPLPLGRDRPPPAYRCPRDRPPSATTASRDNAPHLRERRFWVELLYSPLSAWMLEAEGRKNVDYITHIKNNPTQGFLKTMAAIIFKNASKMRV